MLLWGLSLNAGSAFGSFFPTSRPVVLGAERPRLSYPDHSRSKAAVRGDHREPHQRACPLTVARAEGNFAVVNRSELDHGEAGDSLEIAEIQRRNFVAEMQRCRADQQILERKLDTHRFLLAFDPPG